jgi:heme a synthase
MLPEPVVLNIFTTRAPFAHWATNVAMPGACGRRPRRVTMNTSAVHTYAVIMERPWLHRYAILLSVCTLFLIVAGATVTSKEAGLSVPDWPLSYGKLMPPMTGGVFFEHGHRMVGTLVGMLTIGLLIWLLATEKRTWMRKLGWVALGGVIFVGLLGGLTVKMLTPPPVSIFHTCMAQLFFSLTVAIAVFTSRSWHEGPVMIEDQGTPSLRTLAILTPVAVLIQISLGAGFRQRAIGVMPHLLGAMVVSLVIMFSSVCVLQQCQQHRPLRLAAKALLGVTGLQVFLGLSAFTALTRSVPRETEILVSTVAHVATGALTLAASIVLAIQIRRNVRARAPEAADSTEAAVTS